MSYDPARHHRRSIRLPAYDYTQPGAYFVTVVTYQRECLVDEIADGQVRLTRYGEIVHSEWLRSAQVRPEIGLDEFVVMPNHIHGIVIIRGAVLVGAHGRAPLHPYRSPRSLGSFVAGFKSAATKRINALRRMPGVPVWQRNYYERVVRNEEELNRIRQYILENPLRWAEDPENPNVGAASHARPRSLGDHRESPLRDPP